MSANMSGLGDDTALPPDEAQALALWTFVSVNIPRFNSATAREVVAAVAPHPEESLKAVAKRLRRELAARGIHLKHVHSLDAASRIFGHNSWYAARQVTARLRLRLTLASEVEEPDEQFASWAELAPRLCELCVAAVAEAEATIVQVKFGPAFMMLGVPSLLRVGDVERTEFAPILFVNSIGDPESWLDDSPATLERLRRVLEESGLAVLDGVAVLQLCDRRVAGPGPQAVRPSDAGNSELILLREDNGVDSYEIARGDELICWSQIELAEKYRAIEIELEEGAWLVGGGRYVWHVATLHPKDYVPGLVTYGLSVRESESLLRRYRMAKRVLSGPLKHHEVTKRLQYLGQPSDTWRVDMHKLLLLVDKAGLKWDDYDAQGDWANGKPHSQLPVGVVMFLLERLNLSDPNVVLARPSRAELTRVDNDELLRALIPRVDHVTYRVSSDLSDEQKEVVSEAIEEFAASMQLQKRVEGGAIRFEGDPLPYLVYAGDGEELRLKLHAQGLVMFAGVMPRLFKTDGIIEKVDNMWPFALGHTLYLDVAPR